MQHIKVVFEQISSEASDMLVALLPDMGYDGFEEIEGGLLAYVAERQYDAEELSSLAAGMGITYSTEVVAAQNWNALWEANFEPVVVDGLCTIRAHFHDIAVTTPYEIVITPKMSFGTGHHATTQLVMMAMRGIELQGKTVLDFGTGTGVLAIFAEQLGAAAILGIDNDEWSVENAIENVDRNKCSRIRIALGGIDEIAATQYDVLLANINRHILLRHMDELYSRLNEGGTIIMSGLLNSDEEIMLEAAAGAGFKFVAMKEKNNWIALHFDK